MPARCPQCNACINKLPNGRFPAACPKCSNEFRLHLKESGEAGKSAGAPARTRQRLESAESPSPKAIGRIRLRATKSEEEKVSAGRQVRRPTGDRRRRDDDNRDDEFEEDDDLEDENFDVEDDRDDEEECRRRSGSSERGRRSSGSRERPARTSSEERRRQQEKRSKSAEVVFGITEPPASIPAAFKPKTKRGLGVVGAIVWASCLALGVGVLAGIKHGDLLLAWATAKQDAGMVETRIENLERNYALLTPVGAWKQVADPKGRGVDAVFERIKPAAFIEYASGEYPLDQEPKLEELADQLSREWRVELASYLEIERAPSTLSSISSLLVSGEGLLDGVLVRREAQLLVHKGIWYRFTIAASPEDFAALSQDFDHAKAGFTVLNLE